MDLAGDLLDLVDGLTTAGLPTSLDRTATSVPGAWLNLTGVNPSLTLAGGYRGRGVLYVLVPDNATPAVLDDLSAALDQTLAAISDTPGLALDPTTEITPATVTTDTSPLPALAVPITWHGTTTTDPGDTP